MKLEEKKRQFEDEIAGCNRLLKYEPNNYEMYFIKGNALAKLGCYAKDIDYYNQANECYNKAIKLFPNNSLYFAERATVNIALKKMDNAVEDIKQAKALLEESEGIEKIHIKNIITDIEKELGYKILLEKTEYYSTPLIQLDFSNFLGTNVEEYKNIMSLSGANINLQEN